MSVYRCVLIWYGCCFWLSSVLGTCFCLYCALRLTRKFGVHLRVYANVKWSKPIFGFWVPMIILFQHRQLLLRSVCSGNTICLMFKSFWCDISWLCGWYVGIAVFKLRKSSMMPKYQMDISLSWYVLIRTPALRKRYIVDSIRFFFAFRVN